MRQESGNEMDPLMEGIAEDLDDTPRKGQSMRDESFIDFKKRLIYWGAGIFIFLLLFIMFFGGGSTSQKELQAIAGRLGKIEANLESFTGIEQRITQIEKQLTKLEKDFFRLQKAVKTAGRQAGGRVSSPAGGGRRYHTVVPGESLYLIAKQYDISIAEICRYNQITPKKVIQPGQDLWIEPASE